MDESGGADVIERTPSDRANLLKVQGDRLVKGG